MATDSSVAAVLTDADEVDRRIQQRIGKELKVGLFLATKLGDRQMEAPQSLVKPSLFCCPAVSGWRDSDLCHDLEQYCAKGDQGGAAYLYY